MINILTKAELSDSAAKRAYDYTISTRLKLTQLWQTVAILSLILAFGLFILLAAHMTAPKYIPYVVYIENDGTASFEGMVKNKKLELTDGMVRAALTRFITLTRTISTDIIVVKKNMIESYSLATSKAGSAKLSPSYQKDNPLVLHEQGIRREVQLKAFYKQSDTQWRAEWVEIYFTQGSVSDKITYNGTFSFVQLPAKDEKIAEKNPLGIYFDEYHIVEQ